MRVGAVTERTHLSIREVLDLLVVEFPDVTISKIRFLESQGLIRPERTPSGYRKFYDTDVERLRWILRQQREHFLPLKVIKGRLDEASGLGGHGPVEASLFDEDYAAPPAEAGPLVGIGSPARAPGLRAVPQSEPVRASRPGGPAVVHVRAAGSAGQASALLAAHDVEERPHRVPVELAAPAPAEAPGPGTKAAPLTRSVAAPPVVAGATTSASNEDRLDAPKRPSFSAPPAHVTGTEEGSGRSRHVESSAGRAGGGESSPGQPSPAQPSLGQPSPGQPSLGQHVPEKHGTPPAGSGPRTSRGGSRTEGRSRADGTSRRQADVHSSAGADAHSSAGADVPSAGARRRPAPGAPDGAAAKEAAGLAQGADDVDPDLTGAPSSFSAEELAAAVGIAVEVVRELEEYGFLASRLVAGVPCYGEDALVVARLAAGFRAYGIESRHLRTFKHAAEREAGLFSQVVTPLLRQRNPAAHERAQAALAELTELGCALHASLVRSELRDLTGG